MAVREPDLRLFRATLTSILEQTYADFELLILDRGVSDQVRDVIAWYRERKAALSGCVFGRGAAGVINKSGFPEGK